MILFSRHMRKLAAAVAVVFIFFSQLVAAAQACATFDEAKAASSIATMPMGQGGMSAEHERPLDAAMQVERQNDCVKHCQASRETIDHQPVSPVFPVLGPVRYVEQSDPLAGVFQSTQRYSHALLARVTAPPLSVRNCCFRT